MNAANAPAPTVIKVEDASVIFRVREYQFNSFKEWVMLGLGRKNSVRKIEALKNINLEIKRGESVAFIGHNGSGKSTLLKVIAGVIEIGGAKVVVDGRVGPMIELGTGFDPELSGRENIYLACTLMGLTEKQITDRLDEIVRFAELQDFITIPFKNYSSGMQARLGFACTTAVEPDILLVDEVLAVGDANFTKKCLERIHRLREQGCTIVMVSHDDSAVRTFCERGIVFENGNMRFDGPVDQALQRHTEIMHERYLASLPEKAREEYYRKKEMQENDSIASGDPTRPQKILAQIFMVQGDELVPEVDFAKPFSIEFLIRISEMEKIDGELSVGFAFHNPGGRIGGVNNQQLKCEIPVHGLPKDGPFRARFSFGEGMPLMMAGHYDIILGIHDRNLRRTLFIDNVGLVHGSNSLTGINTDADLLDIAGQATGFKILKGANNGANVAPDQFAVHQPSS